MEELQYDSLIAGDVDIVTEPIIIGASQTIKRGDVLEKTVTEAIAVSGAVGTKSRTVATNYVRPSAAANPESFYAVASEDVTTGAGESAIIIGYKTGQFNPGAMRFGGASTAVQNKDVLADKAIYLVTIQE